MAIDAVACYIEEKTQEAFMDIKTADRLASLRRASGLSQEELADKLGVSRQAVSKWERNESSPDTDNLIELSKIYNVSLDELLFGEQIPQSDAKDDECERDGKKVSVNGDEITVSDEDGTRTYSKEKTIRTMKNEKKVGQIIGVYTLAVVIAYLILGFTLGGDGWGKWWFLFITIPIPSSIVTAILRKRVVEFIYPCFAAAVYCAIGTLAGIWHPTWVIFVTIPAFYTIAGIIDHARHTDDFDAVINAIDK